MRKLDQVEKHMLNDMMKKSSLLICGLVKNEDDFKNIVIIERIANILISRLRKFFRLMDNKDEVYEFIKQIPALNKMRAPQKHKLVSIIIKFLI